MVRQTAVNSEQAVQDIERDLKAYDATITQADDRLRFADLLAMWSAYRDRPENHDRGAEEINALLATMVDWNRLEGVRSIETADVATRTVTATVLAFVMLGDAIREALDPKLR